MTIIVEWEEIHTTPTTEAVSYNVYRSPDDTADSYTLQATVPTNVYADGTGTDTDYYYISGLDRHSNESATIAPIRQYSLTAPSQEIGVCNIFGTILDVNGHPNPDVTIDFHICSSEAPQTIQNTGMNTHGVMTTTNPNGYFSVNLVRGVLLTMKVYGMRKMLKFAVPDVASIDFKDLVGTEVEIENPF